MEIEEVGLVAYFGVLLSVVVFRWLQRNILDRKSENRLVDEFSSGLVMGCRSKSLRSLKDIEKMYDGICSNQDAQDRYCDLHKHLGQAHARVVQRDRKMLGKECGDEEVRSLTSFIADAMDNLQYESRFKELPETERNLLTDAASFADEGDKESVKRKLSEIATAVRTREEELRRAEQGKKIGYALAILGFLATVWFGLT